MRYENCKKSNLKSEIIEMGGKNFMIDRKDKWIFFTKGQSYKTYKNNVILQWKASKFVTHAKSYYIKVIFSVILQVFLV